MNDDPATDAAKMAAFTKAEDAATLPLFYKTFLEVYPNGTAGFPTLPPVMEMVVRRAFMFGLATMADKFARMDTASREALDLMDETEREAAVVMKTMGRPLPQPAPAPALDSWAPRFVLQGQ